MATDIRNHVHNVPRNAQWALDLYEKNKSFPKYKIIYIYQI